MAANLAPAAAEERIHGSSSLSLPHSGQTPFNLPRITIKYCTQCKWMLRAAYFAQELLSTFSTDIGEIALIPATGGIFAVSIFHTSSAAGAAESAAPSPSSLFNVQETLLWDRKRDGGFPETKQLKSLVRNIIDPSRDLGHVDRALAKSGSQQGQQKRQQQQHQEEQEQARTCYDRPMELSQGCENPVDRKECEDCK
ncbi:hypothetical protein VTO42DRAFT_377 [Malbranchea cinnamomea]